MCCYTPLNTHSRTTKRSNTTHHSLFATGSRVECSARRLIIPPPGRVLTNLLSNNWKRQVMYEHNSSVYGKVNYVSMTQRFLFIKSVICFFKLLKLNSLWFYKENFGKCWKTNGVCHKTTSYMSWCICWGEMDSVSKQEEEDLHAVRLGYVAPDIVLHASYITAQEACPYHSRYILHYPSKTTTH